LRIPAGSGRSGKRFRRRGDRHPDHCSTACYCGVTPECYLACPAEDTDSFVENGCYIRFEIKDIHCLPIPGIPASDFWLIDCDPLRDLALCGGSASIDADSATNSNGVTTMSLGALKAGRCAQSLAPVCQGIFLEDGNHVMLCWDIRVRSVDLNGDLVVNLVDLSSFAGYYPPQAYNSSADFDCNGVVGLSDLSRFAQHYGQPGHECS
jgi:hypothetical protein